MPKNLSSGARMDDVMAKAMQRRMDLPGGALLDRIGAPVFLLARCVVPFLLALSSVALLAVS
jgi:hypothetical protein